MNEKLIKRIIMVLIVIFVFLIMVVMRLTSEKPNPKPMPDNTEIEESIVNTEEPEIEDSDPNISIPIEVTKEEYEKVENTFDTFYNNIYYQTNVVNGDTLLDITFQGYGTVTFKMYDKTAPNSVKWFKSLVDNNVSTKFYKIKDTSKSFYFETSEREYDRKEQVEGIFPMKYCLYQILYSCHTFYFCTSDYTENTIDNELFDAKYIEYLNTYDGDMSVYQNCVVLGYAINNREILDQIGENFVIESMQFRIYNGG